MNHSPSLQRTSPVQFDARPLRTESRDGWPVVLEYAGEGTGPWLVDLSHCSRWDLQPAQLDELDPDITPAAGLAVPERAGGCHLHQGVLASRLGPGQAALWHLHGQPAATPAATGFTDVSDATALLALLGKGSLEIAARLSRLDLARPGAETPCVHQGPLAHVACQVVVLDTGRSDPARSGVLIASARGYARSMVEAIFEAGATEELCAAGEARFAPWSV